MNEDELKELRLWVKSIDAKLDNHLISIGKEISQIKNDISWLKWFFFTVVGAAMTIIVGAFFKLIIYV